MNRRARNFCGALVLTVLLMGPSVVQAVNCQVRFVAMNFGTYMPLRTVPLDAIGEMLVRCQAQPGSFTVALGPGLGGDPLNRAMTSPNGGTLLYNLYTDPARSRIWGDGSGGTSTLSGSRSERGRPTSYAFPIFGRVFAGQAPEAGTYGDSVLVTVLF